MKKNRHFLTALIISFIVFALSCSSGEVEQPVPNPGFGIYSTYRSPNNFERVLGGAHTSGEIGRSLFGTLVGIGSDATGTYTSFDIIANSKGKAYAPDRIAPAFYAMTAVGGWDVCTGMRGTASIDRGILNHFECVERKLGGPVFGGIFNPPIIHVTEAPVEFTMAGEGVNATYGMPTFQFYNQYGTLVAQAPASQIDTENGLWAKGSSSCLSGLPVGSYDVWLINATADGIGQRVGADSAYLDGGPNMVAIDDPSFFVDQHYLDFLNRDPDEQGWINWTSKITQCGQDASCIASKRIEVSRGFWYSDEFQQLHPGLRNPLGIAPDFNNAEFVRLCFVIYLRRDPDQATYDTSLAQLNSTNDYNQIISAFINSDEYRSRFVPQISEPPPPDPDPCSCPRDMACMPCYNY